MAALGGYFRTSILLAMPKASGSRRRIREFEEILGVSAQDLKQFNGDISSRTRPIFPTVPDKISAWAVRKAKQIRDLILSIFLFVYCWARETVEDSDPLSI